MRIYSNKKFDPTKFFRDELNWKNTIEEVIMIEYILF